MIDMLPILVFDPDLNYVDQIDGYEYLRWTRRWRRPHDWEIHINRYIQGAVNLKEGYYIAIRHKETYRAGRIAYKDILLTQEGRLSENWSIRGYDSSGVFYDRLCLHGVSSGNGYDTQNDNAETVMRHYVNINAINPVIPERKAPYLVLGTNLGRGPQTATRARFQTVAEMLETISLGSGLGYETFFDMHGKQFVFTVMEGRDLSPSQNINPPVTFSPEFDNAKMLGYRWSQLDSKNFAVVAGQGEAQDREIVEIHEGNPSGYDRREVFFDARDLETTDQLTQRGNERLAEYAEELVMEVEALPKGPFVYREDYDLGDVVHVRYPEIGSMDTRIIEAIEEYDTTSQGIRLVFGREWPDMRSVMREQRRNTEGEVRR